MKRKIKNKITFPKGFFNNIKPYRPTNKKKDDDYDKPFEWSENALNGNVKIIVKSLKIK